MAPSHVPADQLPLQGTIYNNPSYQNLFSDHQYDPQSWNGQLTHHAGLVPDTAQSQPWHHNAYSTQPYNQISQPYANQGQAHRTTSPYQFGQFGNHPSPTTNYGHATNVDPSLGVDPNAVRRQQQSPYQMGVLNAPAQSRSNTVTPQSLQQNLPVQDPRPPTSPYQIPKPTADTFAQRPAPTVFAQPVANPEYDIPKGRKSGGFIVLDQATLMKATKSNALNKLVTLGSEPFHFPSNRTALPLYTPRQSVKDLKKFGADSKKLAKKTPTKSSAGRVRKREVSDSESSDESSSDDSDYSDAEEVEQSPLPATKPEEPQAASRYDIIKATWYPRQSQPNPDKIKSSLRDLFEILTTIHQRWRMDSKAVVEAEQREKKGELPVLKRRVAEQRDLFESALKSILEFAHPTILHHLPQVKQLFHYSYQFLANRCKMGDYDGSLSSTIMEMLVRCLATITTELLEETKLTRALNILKKNANDKNKALIQQIEDGVAAGSKKAKVSSPSETDVAAGSKSIKRPATQPAGRTTAEAHVVKKLKPSDTVTNVVKKPSTAVTSKVSPATTTSQQKRPGERPATAPAKARGIQIVNKPSTLFASLNAAGKKPTTTPTSASNAKSAAKPSLSASKDKKPAAAPIVKPAFSFAETMAELLKPKEAEVVVPTKAEKQLPPETPEEKTKRLRKESRRHLRVKFRPGDALVSIKYFHHEPEEESGHDENFVRDAGDVGGEGRMFKQHKDMADEDDEEDLEIEHRPWKEPSLVDFSVVNPEERKRNYEPYGGGELKPTCPVREANIAHEKVTLMVHYTLPSEIPSSPREPLLQQTPPSTTSFTNFGPPPQLVLDRLPKPAVAPPTTDFSNLEMIVQQLKNNPLQANANPSSYAPVSAAPPPAVTPDLSSILGALSQIPGHNPGQAPMPFPPVQQPAAPPAMDLSAILAMAQQWAPQAGVAFPQPSALPSWPGFPPTAPQQQQQQQQQQQDGGSAYQNQQSQQNQNNRPSHKRQREDNRDINDRALGTNKRNKSSDRGLDQHLRPHRVVLCKFYQKGMCTKGDDCTFIHDENA